MSTERIAKLVETLTTKTIQGELDWEATGSNAFQASFSNYSTLIREVTPDEDLFGKAAPAGYHVMILNDFGEVIEKIGPSDLEGYVDEPDEILKALFNVVRRKAMGVDDAVNTILDELNAPPY